MIDALRCELALSIRRCFLDEMAIPVTLDDELMPKSLKEWAWRLIRNGVVSRDGGRCRQCGKDLTRVPSWMTEVHHVRPRNQGGCDHPSNLITLCTMCHKRVSADTLLAQSGGRSPWDDCLPRESLEAFR